MDIETDPFAHGRAPQAFALGYYDGNEYRDFWGDDCVRQFARFIRHKPPMFLYAHNGGRFDFFYLWEWMENPMRIINGRIVSAKFGHHTLRDSYAIFPVALRTFGSKLDIDYSKMERQNRDQHKDEILRYLRADCESLYSTVANFRARFGNVLTIGSAAIKELSALHPFDHQNESHDCKFREYYSGGRVECFEAGALAGKFRVYDVNSMYPHVMREYLHPTGRDYVFTTSIQEAIQSERPFFADIEYNGTGARIGAFATHGRDGKVSYPTTGRIRAFATSHEIIAALDLGLLPHDFVCHAAYVACEAMGFARFVDYWMAEKVAAKERQDVAGYTFAKLILNSAYGKFGSDPREYKDFRIVRNGEPCPPGDWQLHSDYGFLYVMEREAPIGPRAFFDVATAASVTGAARAVLLRALVGASRPVYCDTDSIVCERLRAPIDASRLGAWKLEATGNRAYIGGKKLYALKNGARFVKTASKGVVLTGDQICAIVSEGSKITYRREAPTFRLSGKVDFITREVKCTAKKS